MSEQGRLKMTQDGRVVREGSEHGNECNSCGQKHACISFLAHENAMMHKDTDNERAHRTTLFVCITFIIITTIFVLAYTLRMNAFLDTINKMTAALMEMAGAKGFPTP